MMNKAALPEVSCDDWYGGRLRLTQPKSGFRANLDAILLAAAVPVNAQYVLELGAGVGGAALALAARLPKVSVLAVERDPFIAKLLVKNISDNNLTDQVRAQEGDAFAAGSEQDPEHNPKHNWANSWDGRHDVVMINPPYNDASSTLSDDAYRRDAMAEGDLVRWIKAAATGLVHKGRLVMISRADRLDDVMAGLTPIFGDISIRAIHTMAEKPAKRVLISARKGVEGPVVMLPPFVVGDSTGQDSDDMAAVNPGGGSIDMIPPGRQMAKLSLPDF